jgi:hypothetical protein
MKQFWKLLFTFAILTSGLQVLAQCPIGTVKVRGRLENLPPDAAQPEVLVTLETPKGSKSKTAPLSNNEFAVDVPFGTQGSPYFPLWGHRCNIVPKFVEIKATIGNQVVGEVRLKFKDDFEIQDPFTYRLKHELIIKASKVQKKGG